MIRIIFLTCLLALTLGCNDKQVNYLKNGPTSNLVRTPVRYNISNIAADSRYYHLHTHKWVISVPKGRVTIFISDENYVNMESIIDKDTNDTTPLLGIGRHYLYLTEQSLARLSRYEAINE